MAEIKLKVPRFYYPTGEPAYDATLREARKLNLYPSVTTVISVMAKPQLERWKQMQVVLAAVTRTHISSEDPEKVAQEIIDQSEREAALAAQWGTDFHELIQKHAQGYPVVPGAMEPHWLRFKAWWDQTVAEVVWMEKGLASPEGYAGRGDIKVILRDGGRPTLMDFKGRKAVKGKPAWYDEQVMQLSAYAWADQGSTNSKEQVDCMSVVVDRDLPSAPWPRLWSEEEVIRGRKMFRHCLELWKHSNDYFPQ